jgi:alditol oxidase
MRNWAGNIDFGAAAVARPESVDALRRVVAGSARIRALGARHTFSEVLATTGDFVRLDGLPPTVDIDPAARTASVAAGMRYAEVADVLHRAGFALANLASLPDITVAGAIATGSHGSGDTLGSLATAVTGMEMVDAEGDLVELRRNVDQDTFAGTVISLGALGIVAKVTLEIEPFFDVAQSARVRVPLAEVQARFDDVSSAAYSVSVFTQWGDDASLWLKRRTDRPVVDLDLGIPASGQLNPVPGADPAPCTAQLGLPGPWHQRLPHIRFGTSPQRGDELQSEYFLPRSAVPSAIDGLRGLCRILAPVLLVSEIRTVRGDDLWLSPAYQQDSVTFHFTWVRDVDRVWPAIAAVEELLVPLGARPHWAKLTAITRDAVLSGYHRAADFGELRRKADPGGKFSNDFIEKMFPQLLPMG